MNTETVNTNRQFFVKFLERESRDLPAIFFTKLNTTLESLEDGAPGADYEGYLILNRKETPYIIFNGKKSLLKKEHLDALREATRLHRKQKMERAKQIAG